MEVSFKTKHIYLHAVIQPLAVIDEHGNDLECVHTFEVEYPDLSKRFLPENLNIEFDGVLYMSTGGQVLLPNINGGAFGVQFTHEITKAEIPKLFSAYSDQIYELEDFFENGKGF